MSNKRYIAKTTKEPKRGESGTITMYYGYDTQDKTRVTATSPLKEDVVRILGILMEK